MKKQDIYKELSNIDQEMIADADPGMPVRGAGRRHWRVTALIAACLSLVILTASLFMLLPNNRGNAPEQPKDGELPAALKAHADSDYIELMLALYNYDQSLHVVKANNSILDAIEGLFRPKQDDAVNYNGELMGPDAPTAAGRDDYGDSGEGNGYIETTDNQVAGVIEADLVKRTASHIFYLDRNAMTVRVYSIKGEESACVAKLAVDHGYENMLSGIYNARLFLSEDGKTLIVLGDVIGQLENGSAKTKIGATLLLAYDVSDPENISPKGHLAICGSYLSARMTRGKLLLMSAYNIERVDYEDEMSFLPVIDRGEGFRVMAAEDIVFPEELTSRRYTVVTQVDTETLALDGAIACLCYSDDVYVSADKIYLTRTHTNEREYRENGDTLGESSAATEILAVGYGKSGFCRLGGIEIDGTVKDQYSLDEYEGKLRVVTTLTSSSFKVNKRYDSSITRPVERRTNAALYCIDLGTWQIVGEVRNFAPDGETAESVRFDGNKVYVCTAVVVKLSDPVYFFDLSDVSNITYTDTGTIEGYSSSLVDFGEGMLLGIGYGADRFSLKLEIYTENGDKVESVCTYEEHEVSFSEDYKSYFIDRERGLVGLMVNNMSDGIGASRYILLCFNGCKFIKVADESMEAWQACDFARAVLADKYFYIMASEEFKVLKLYN